MQTIFLLNYRRLSRNIDALLGTFGITELAADTGIRGKIRTEILVAETVRIILLLRYDLDLRQNPTDYFFASAG